MLTMSYFQGDIVLITFPFSDNSGQKQRPAIVISNAIVNKKQDLIVAQVTSSLSADEFSFTLQDKHLNKPLPYPSEVRCHKIFSLEKSQVIKKIATLKPDKKAELIAQIHTFIQVPPTKSK